MTSKQTAARVLRGRLVVASQNFEILAFFRLTNRERNNKLRAANENKFHFPIYLFAARENFA